MYNKMKQADKNNGKQQISSSELDVILCSPEPLLQKKHAEAMRQVQEHIDKYQIDQKIAKLFGRNSHPKKSLQ